MTDDPGPDELVKRIHATWDAHIAALSMPNNDVKVRRAFIEVLKAERVLEQYCLDHCVQEGTRALYRATIADYDARIEDEERDLAKIEGAEYHRALMAPIAASWGNDSEPECSICGGPRGHYGECK